MGYDQTIMSESHTSIETSHPRPTHNSLLLSETYGIGTRISLRDAAEKLEIARSELGDILCGRAPISLPVALRIAEHFGGSAVAWHGDTPAN